jgi:chromosome partitioning protein
LNAESNIGGGRCRIAVVGMRIDARTRAEDTLRAWADVIGAPFLGVLRDTQTYVRCVERGLTIFDLPSARAQADRDQWQPILDWLDPLWAGRELGTPSQAGALDEVAAPIESVPAVRVTRPVSVRPVYTELADALKPAPALPRGLLQRMLGVQAWPWQRTASAR